MNKYKLYYETQRFIEPLMTGKALTDQYIAHCSKSIFRFIANSKDLQMIFAGMSLKTLYRNEQEIDAWIEWNGKRLTYDFLYYNIINIILNYKETE